MTNRFLPFLVLFVLALSACAPTAIADMPVPTALPATQIPSPASPQPSPTPLPSATPTPAPTDTPTATFTPTPTPNPMSIAAMRAGSYPGSDITIEQELAPGANYRRYYASYRSEGLKIYALLTVPNGAPPAGGWPGIVFNHGYIPPQVYHTTERYVAYVDRLAQAGYVVFRIDYRGHDKSEGVARGAYGDPGYTVDVLNAVASLKRFPQVNPEEIGMWGHSMGGFLTLRAMVISKDVKAGVIWSGVVGSYADMATKWRRAGPVPTAVPTARGWRREWTEQYGSPEQNPNFWNSVSANASLADISGPLQLHASLADEEVPSEFSQSLAKELQSAGKTVDLHIYKNDDHNLSKNFSTAMGDTIAFFDQYLKKEKVDK